MQRLPLPAAAPPCPQIHCLTGSINCLNSADGERRYRPVFGSTSPQFSPKLLAAIESAAFMQCLVTAEVEALNGPTTREQFAQECMRTGAALALQMQAAPGKRAIHSLLLRLQHDPRLAYYFDPLTQSFEDLTEAHALHCDLPDLQHFRKVFANTLQFEPPAQGGAA